MKKKYYWIIIIILFGLLPKQGLAQITIPEIEKYLDRVRLNHAMEDMRKNTYNDVEGSPFMPKEFQQGKIQVKGEGLYSSKLRYDMYTNVMQFMAKGIVYVIAFPEDIEFVEIEDLKFIYTPYLSAPSGTDLKESYFVVLMNGNCKLLTKKEVLLLDAEPAKPYVDAKPAHFIQKKDSYFIKKNDLPAVKISSRKSLIGILEDKETEVLSFIKKEKISHNDLEDLKKLIEYYNSLEEMED
ncbi:MAG: hypothetical protein KAX05_13310 [Bacteroidales bacterium]|nr:hypothetical protein [Bacteroidales bacterium]